MATEEFNLNIWRVHPYGCPVVPAERTLRDTANPDAVRWCGPFTHANKAGWWLFPPVDVDITWQGGTEFEWELHTPYTNADGHLIRFLLDDEDGASPGMWLSDPEGGRTKFTFGQVEPAVAQIWTGCIFETPPGWALHLRNPINCANPSFRVMDAMLETDWLQYDIWLNLAFHNVGEKVELRRDGWPPLAQIVPVRKESYDARWNVSEELINRDSADANRVFEYFVEYNEKKFARGGKQWRGVGSELAKDSRTYYRERRRARG